MIDNELLEFALGVDEFGRQTRIRMLAKMSYWLAMDAGEDGPWPAEEALMLVRLSHSHADLEWRQSVHNKLLRNADFERERERFAKTVEEWVDSDG